jgi:membrane-associated protease RseP (regulator of RpoE activity)
LSTFSSSLAVGWLAKVIAGRGQLLFDSTAKMVGVHPLVVIGANCMTIAALNLLPMRQLDGGRIVSAIYGRKTALLMSRVTIMFMLLASAKNSYLFVFLVLLMFGPWSLDRPAKNELTEPNNTRALVGFAFLLIMLAVLLPYPYHVPFRL